MFVSRIAFPGDESNAMRFGNRLLGVLKWLCCSTTGICEVSVWTGLENCRTLLRPAFVLGQFVGKRYYVL